MSDDIDARILWLAAMISMPRWQAAARFAFDRTKQLAGFDAADLLQQSGILHLEERSRTAAGFAKRVKDPVVRVAWELLALRTDDGPMVIHAAVAGAVGLLAHAVGDTREALAKLRVWDDVARHKYDPAAYRDFFELGDMYWRGEMQFIVAAAEGDKNNMRPKGPDEHPAFATLMADRWDDAYDTLLVATRPVLGDHPEIEVAETIEAMSDWAAIRATILELVDHLYAVGTPTAGAMALAWEMLTADPRRPESFRFMPQLQFSLDQADLDANNDAEVRERIRIWWRAAEGEWTDSDVSIFRIADVETRPADDMPDPEPLGHTSTPQTLFADLGLPTVVVMPKDKSSKLNNYHAAYKDLVDVALPLVVVRDVARIRAALHTEFPHATVAVDLLLRDLRDQRPFRLKPVCLVGSPGAGKSRLVRRLADLARGLYVYRFDASSSTDAVAFSGSAKSWANTEPSVPFRAVAQSRTANPIVLIDEIDKAAERNWNGRLWDALLPFCDPETAGRYRDQSLDAELDLSMCSFVATANDVSKLPSPLRDRLRMIKVPTPTLQHLPALAASVMRDLAAEDEGRHHDAPLAGDELAVIGRAWERSKFSMRALQKSVSATLEARDQFSMRH